MLYLLTVETFANRRQLTFVEVESIFLENEPLFLVNCYRLISNKLARRGPANEATYCLVIKGTMFNQNIITLIVLRCF